MNERDMIELADAAMADVELYPDEDGPWYRSEPYFTATMLINKPTFLMKLFRSEPNVTFGVEFKTDEAVTRRTFSGPFSETLAQAVFFISSNIEEG